MVGGLVFFIIFILVIAAIIKDGLFIVKQQHAGSSSVWVNSIASWVPAST